MDQNVDYKELYLLLFRAITKGLDALQERNYALAQTVLIKAQQEAEERYLSAGE